MKEKKLTDEEIVKALEHCYHNRSCEYCYHNDENGSGEIVCRSRLMEKALDLIHRLQGENKQLKCDSYRTSWKAKFLEAKKEIERLTEERDMYADDLYWKAEVRKREDFITELTVENAELQKKVDEWTDVFGSADNFARVISNLRMKNGNRIATSQELLEWVTEKTEQAVKDAAREIFTELLKEFSKRKSCGNADVVVREMASRKGVEVE